MTRYALPSLTALLSAVALLSACGPQDGAAHAAQTSVETPKASAAPKAQPPVAKPVALRGEAGVITAVVPLRTTEKPSGAGALIGGVVGAAVGNQIGDGNGRKVATVVGAVGGAAAGHRIEKDRNTSITGYRIELQLDNGRKTSVTQSQPGALAAGQRVRLVDGNVVPA